MEYTTVLVMALTAITAVVTLKKSAVDLKSAQIRLEVDMAQRTAPPHTSARSQRSSPRALILFASLLLLFSMATLLWLAFGPLSGNAPTLKDLALVAFSIINVVQAYRWL